MRRKIGTLLAGLLLVAGLAAPAGAQQSTFQELTPLYDPFTESVAEESVQAPSAYFVELKGAPTVEGGSEANLKKEKESFKAKAKKAGLDLNVRFEYQDLFNGFSVKATPAEAKKLAKLEGVKSVQRVYTFAQPDGEASPDLATAISQTGADIVQSEMGYTGKTIRVAVMDTGVDYDHPDLGGCFGQNCRVFTGWDFVGDAYDANPNNATYNPNPVPDADPDDCQGHGTHVAGIIGANGTVKGVAPDVRFGSYRVFGCNGSTEADIMVAAMERAHKDNMQILNMSIGSSYTWPQYPTAVAANRLVESGMVVVASIGNSGASGLWSLGAPGVGEDVIGVASMENTHTRLAVFTIDPDGSAIGYQGATAAPTPPTSGSANVVTIANVEGCTAGGGVPGTAAGSVVLIKRGTCTFYEKAANAQAAGAVGVILYNNVGGRINPTVAGATEITIPVVSITLDDGNKIASLLGSGSVTMTWTAEKGVFANPGANLASTFTSYGLAPDLSLKPDIAAPGGNIYSTYPLEKGGYATLSGTSMASPHTAGAVALLLDARPQTKAAEVRSLLQNYAVPQLWWGNPGLGILDGVNRQGAGMLQIDKAITAQTRVTPGKLALGESQAGPQTFNLTITNTGKKPVTYTLGYEEGIAVRNTYPNHGWGLLPSNVTFSQPTVTVKQNHSETVSVTISSSLPQGYTYGGWITFTPDNNEETLRVPYAGFAGDYQALPVLHPLLPPVLVQWNGSGYGAPSAGGFTMAGDDLAYFLVHLNHQSTRVRMEVIDATTGDLLGLASPDEMWLPRNETQTGAFLFTWDGTVNGADAPSGDYQIRFAILKALGDESNPAHTETWTSPTITINRS